MGIPRFFGWLQRKYPKITFWQDEHKVDYLYFDFNCLIYQVIRDLFKEEYAKLKERPQREIRARIIQEVIKYTNHILKDICTPTKQLFIGIDGVVPWAKMNQQRSRRYRSPVLQKWEDDLKRRFDMYQESIFDTNQITPGTDFMLELGEALTYAAKHSQYKVGKNVRVVVSDAFVAGEGEHKVLEDIRKNNITDTESICIYGLDADLIMLSLTLPTDNIILLREKTYIDGRGPSKHDLPFMFVSIEEIKSNIFIELMEKIAPKMPGNVQQQLISKQRLINDYIFLSFMLGNDFLHTIPSINIGEGGVDFVINMYCRIFTYHRAYLVVEKDGNYNINHSFLLKIFESLSKSEQNNLKFLQSRKRVPRVPAFEDTYQEEKFRMDRIPLNDEFKKYYSVIDYLSPNWRKEYYQIYFKLDLETEGNQEVLDNIIHNYLEGLIFTIKYYFEGNPSWYWYNPNPVSPFASDIYTYLKDHSDVNSIELEKGTKFSPYEQLLMVLPISSFNMLPQVFKRNINKEVRYKQYYPNTYDFHFEERMMLYSIEPKLPLLNLTDIKDLYNESLKELTSRELLRNESHEVFVK